MIIPRNKEKVISSGFGTTTETSIIASAEMLDILASGVYSDKIKAPIRELSTNAVDAMIEAGTYHDKTFDVQLPTTLEPKFKIRDYGTGLTPEQVRSVFINYGASTKNNSNLFNGAMGIGSKSPFAYTRDYVIKSYKDGIMYFYNYGKNDENKPVLSEAYSKPTDEPNGLEISFAVNPADINLFQTKAQEVYKYFDKKPNTNIKLEYKEDEVILKGSNWKIIKNTNRYYNNKPIVVMANVGYPLDTSIVDTSSVMYKYRNTNIIIDAPTGSVKMAASRETLDMNPKTVQYLEGVFNEIEDTVKNKVLKDIPKDLPKLKKIQKARQIISSLPSDLKINIKIDGIDVTSGYPTWESFIKDTDSIMQYYSTGKGRKLGWWVEGSFETEYKFLCVDKSTRINETINNLRGTNIILFVIRDNKGTVVQKARDIVKSLGYQEKDLLLASELFTKLPKQSRTSYSSGVKTSKSFIKASKLYIPESSTEVVHIGSEYHVQPNDTNKYLYIESTSGSLDLYKRTHRAVVFKTIINQLSIKGYSKDILVVNQQYIQRAKADDRMTYVFDAVSKHNLSVNLYDYTEDDKNYIEIHNSVATNIHKISEAKDLVKHKKSKSVFEVTKRIDLPVKINYKQDYEAAGFTTKTKIKPLVKTDVEPYVEFLNNLTYRPDKYVVAKHLDYISQDTKKEKDE